MSPKMLWWLGIAVLNLFTYEGVALYRAQGETISEVIWWLVAQYPMVAFLLGFLMGHFVWQARANYQAK